MLKKADDSHKKNITILQANQHDPCNPNETNKTFIDESI